MEHAGVRLSSGSSGSASAAKSTSYQDSEAENSSLYNSAESCVSDPQKKKQKRVVSRFRDRFHSAGAPRPTARSESEKWRILVQLIYG
jgi:hypothetical protein